MILVPSRSRNLALVWLIATGLAGACTKKKSEPETPPPARSQNPTPEDSQKPAPGDKVETQSGLSPALKKFRDAVVDKVWRTCYSSTSVATLIEIDIRSNRTWKATSTDFAGNTCTGKPLKSESEEGSYTIEAEIRPNVYPLNLTRTGDTPIYEITSLRGGDRLHFGRTDDLLDASSPEKRPLELDTAAYYMTTAKPPLIKLDLHD